MDPAGPSAAGESTLSPSARTSRPSESGSLSPRQAVGADIVQRTARREGGILGAVGPEGGDG